MTDIRQVRSTSRDGSQDRPTEAMDTTHEDEHQRHFKYVCHGHRLLYVLSLSKSCLALLLFSSLSFFFSNFVRDFQKLSFFVSDFVFRIHNNLKVKSKIKTKFFLFQKHETLILYNFFFLLFFSLPPFLFSTLYVVSHFNLSFNFLMAFSVYSLNFSLCSTLYFNF